MPGLVSRPADRWSKQLLLAALLCAPLLLLLIRTGHDGVQQGHRVVEEGVRISGGQYSRLFESQRPG